MTVLEWVFALTLGFLYFFLLFTVCLLTFRKGHIVLGIVGIFVPFLWLIGAVLPPKHGSQYEAEQAQYYQAQSHQMAS
jgi:hypothetical protein